MMWICGFLFLYIYMGRDPAKGTYYPFDVKAF